MITFRNQRIIYKYSSKPCFIFSDNPITIIHKTNKTNPKIFTSIQFTICKLAGSINFRKFALIILKS